MACFWLLAILAAVIVPFDEDELVAASVATVVSSLVLSLSWWLWLPLPNLGRWVGRSPDVSVDSIATAEEAEEDDETSLLRSRLFVPDEDEAEVDSMVEANCNLLVLSAI